MNGLDRREAERSMWPGVILIVLAIAVYVIVVPMGALSESAIVIGAGVALASFMGLIGVVMLVVKVLRDRLKDQRTDRYSKDVDR